MEIINLNCSKLTVDVAPDLPILWSNLAFSTSYNDLRGHTHRLYVGAGRGAHPSTGPGRAPGPSLRAVAGRVPDGCRAAAGRVMGGCRAGDGRIVHVGGSWSCDPCG